MIILFIILFAFTIQAQIKSEVDLKFEGDKWHSFVIDSAWLGVHNDTLTYLGTVNNRAVYGYDLPRREDGTYKYWKQINGKLQPVIKYRNTGTSFESKKYTVME